MDSKEAARKIVEDCDKGSYVLQYVYSKIPYSRLPIPLIHKHKLTNWQ